jgi:hypothetical protein
MKYALANEFAATQTKSAVADSERLLDFACVGEVSRYYWRIRRDRPVRPGINSRANSSNP